MGLVVLMGPVGFMGLLVLVDLVGTGLSANFAGLESRGVSLGLKETSSSFTFDLHSFRSGEYSQRFS